MMDDKLALVTGAGSGIGRVCAEALLMAGWRVALSGRSTAALEATAAPFAGRAFVMPCDVAQAEAVAALFLGIQRRFGRLDLLFNNAGVSTPPLLPDEFDASTWQRVVDTNLNGAFYCLSAAFKLMREQQPRGSRIINNGSISAQVPRPKSIAYTATKHAMTGLTRAAALDGRSFNIAVGQIDVGNAASEMTSPMAAGIGQPDGSIQSEPRMTLDDVAQSFMAMVNLPLSANVLFMTVMATGMPFVGRG